MRIIQIIIIILISTLKTFGTTWQDPYFEDAINKAALICIGEVQNSSSKETHIKIDKIFKGDHKKSDEVKILRAKTIGIGHENDKLKEGDKFLFIVGKENREYIAFTDSYWNFYVDDTSAIVPIYTPSAYVKIELALFEPFLQLLINQNSQVKKLELLSKISKKLSQTEPLTKNGEEVSFQIFGLEVLQYFGKEELAKFAIPLLQSPYHYVRLSCIRALIRCKGKSSKEAITKQIDIEENSLVQVWIGRAIFEMNIINAKKSLEKQIPKLSTSPISLFSDIMSAANNKDVPPRYSYGAALMKINGLEGTFNELALKSQNYIKNYPEIKLDILEGKKCYYSLEDALNANPDSVYILNLNSEKLTSFPNEIKQFKNLKSLSLFRNKINSLPKFITELELTYLDLGNNELAEIPEEIFECKSLKKLKLKGNKITLIPPLIKNLKDLEVLNLRMNDIKELPLEISLLKKLENIEIYGNEMIKFPSVLFGCHNLKEIRIGSNNLKHLPKEIINLKKLKYIDISYNNLTIKERNNILDFPARIIINSETYENRFYSILEAIENYENAKLIYDSNNDYSKLDFDLSMLISAETLIFENNNLDSFPKALIDLQQLKTLSLEKNNIKDIPNDIFKMKGLKRLNLSNNQLKVIPVDKIRSLNLNYLNLKENKFSAIEKGRIKEELKDIQFLII